MNEVAAVSTAGSARRTPTDTATPTWFLALRLPFE